jgi:hypothetical protein
VLIITFLPDQPLSYLLSFRGEAEESDRKRALTTFEMTPKRNIEIKS